MGLMVCIIFYINHINQKNIPNTDYKAGHQCSITNNSSQVHRTHDPHVSLGRSQREFMKCLGFSRGVDAILVVL